MNPFYPIIYKEMPTSYLDQIGSFADSYLYCGTHCYKFSKMKANGTIEVTPGRLPAPSWYRLAYKIASYIFSLGLLPLAALIAKHIYRHHHPICLRKTPVIRSFVELPINLLSAILSYHFMPSKDILINKNCAQAIRAPLYWKSIFVKLEAIIGNDREVARFVSRIKKLYTSGQEPTYQQKVHYLCLEMWEDVLQVPEAAKHFRAEGLSMGHFADPLQYARFKALIQPAKDSNLISLCKAFCINIPLSHANSDAESDIPEPDSAPATDSEPDDDDPEPNAPVEPDLLHTTDTNSEPNIPDPEVPIKSNLYAANSDSESDLPEPNASAETNPQATDSDSELNVPEPNVHDPEVPAEPDLDNTDSDSESNLPESNAPAEPDLHATDSESEPESESPESNTPRKILRAKAIYTEVCGNSSEQQKADLVREWFFSGELPNYQPDFSAFYLTMLSTEMIECLSKSPNLKMLPLSNINLSLVPSAIGLLDTLKFINFRKNNLKALPETFGNLSQLRWLCLENNSLQALPESIGKLQALRSLYLHNNGLTALPNSFVNLTKLKCFSFKNNKLIDIPETIKKMIEKIDPSEEMSILELVKLIKMTSKS